MTDVQLKDRSDTRQDGAAGSRSASTACTIWRSTPKT